MKNSTLPLPSNRIAWADLLRLFAIFMVIASHCTDPFTVSGEADFKFWGVIYGSFLRSSVPLFAMLTGLLLLPVKEPMGIFYKKRILRVAVPLVIWSVVYNIFPWLSGVLGMDASILDTMFVPFGAPQTTALAHCARNIAMIPFDFTIYTIPMWYIYMLIGLYLFMPIFSAWIEKATKKQKQVYLALWGVTLFFPHVYEFLTVKLFGTCDWNEFGMLYYFAGFNGYLMLGHYLKNGLSISKIKTQLLGLVLFAAGYAITYFGFREMAVGQYNSSWELFYTFCSPNVALMTVGMFLFVQKIEIKSAKIQKYLASLTKCGLGMYMLHYFFVGLAVSTAGAIGIPIPLQILCAAIFVLALCWAITATVYRYAPRAARWILG